MENGVKHIPLIDMQEFPNPEQYKKLREACEDFGCFRLSNHPIPLTLMSEMKKIVRALLDLPTEIKSRNVHAIEDRGYRGPSSKLPFYESLGVCDMACPQTRQTFYDNLDATPHQREIIEKYSQAIHEVAMDLGRKMAESLGVKEVDDLLKGWTCQYRLIKYNFTPETVGKLGAFSHSDSGFLTILQYDEEVGGLEVLDEFSGAFLPVNPMAAGPSLLVNLGDIAKAWSNGRFCNMKHRVVCKEASIRVSIAMFVLGPNEGSIEAPTELVDNEHPQLYIPFTYQDYFNNRLSKDLRNGEVLDLYRTP